MPSFWDNIACYMCGGMDDRANTKQRADEVFRKLDIDNTCTFEIARFEEVFPDGEVYDTHAKELLKYEKTCLRSAVILGHIDIEWWSVEFVPKLQIAFGDDNTFDMWFIRLEANTAGWLIDKFSAPSLADEIDGLCTPDFSELQPQPAQAWFSPVREVELLEAMQNQLHEAELGRELVDNAVIAEQNAPPAMEVCDRLEIDQEKQQGLSKCHAAEAAARQILVDGESDGLGEHMLCELRMSLQMVSRFVKEAENASITRTPSPSRMRRVAAEKSSKSLSRRSRTPAGGHRAAEVPAVRSKAVWEWKDMESAVGWRSYPADLCEQLEEAFENKEKGLPTTKKFTTELVGGDGKLGKFQVFLDLNYHEDVKTHEKTPMRRKERAPSRNR